MTLQVRDLFTGAEDTDITGRRPDGGGNPALQGESTCQWNRVPASPGTGSFDIAEVRQLTQDAYTILNNAASGDVTLPQSRPVGGSLFLVVYSRDATARSADTPSGYTEKQRGSTNGELTVYQRVVDGSEADTLTVTFSGTGAAGNTQILSMFYLHGATAIGTIGVVATWGSQNDFGPITGITPSAPDSTIVLIGAKRDDAVQTPFPASGDFRFLQLNTTTLGNDASVVVYLRRQVGGPTAIPDTTITDTGHPAVGLGFMIEVLQGTGGPSGCRHRTPGDDFPDWNHYVVTDTGVLPSVMAGMVEGRCIAYSHRAQWGAILALHDTAEETGFEVLYDPNFGELDLFQIDTGTYTTLRQVLGLPTPAYGESFTVRLCYAGTNLDLHFEVWLTIGAGTPQRIIPDDGTLDPLGFFSYVPSVGTIPPGYPGACLYDFLNDGSNLRLVEWRFGTECEDVLPSECAPCAEAQAVWGREGFGGGDDADVDGRSLDGGLRPCVANGTWDKRVGDEIGIDTGVGVHVAAGTPVDTAYAVISTGVDPLNQSVVVEYAVDHLTTDPSSVSAYAHMQLDGSGYRARVEQTESQTLYLLERVDAGSPTVLASFDPDVDDVPEGGTGPGSVRICADCEEDGDTFLTLVVKGRVLGTTTDSMYPSGEPGVGILDQDAGGGRSLALTQVDVAGCATDAPECEDEFPGTGETDRFLFFEEQGGFRPVPVPDGISTKLQVALQGAPRVVKRLSVMRRGLWVPVEPGISGGGGTGTIITHLTDPGCTSVIPAGPLTPLSERLCFLFNLPASMLNQGPWTATVEPVGGWTPASLARAAAVGGAIIGAQGGYSQYQTAGAYDPDKMDAKIDGYLPFKAAINAAEATGAWYGYQIFDDWDYPPLWPPSAISNAEISRVAAYYKAVIGGRVVIRAHPDQFLGRPGAITDVDVCLCQYEAYTGPLAPWAARQLAVSHDFGFEAILWSINNYKGGNGSSGIPGASEGFTFRQFWQMSALEVDTYGTYLAELEPAYNHGVGGWRYNAKQLALPGHLDAWGNIRNTIAALPPLP